MWQGTIVKPSMIDAAFSRVQQTAMSRALCASFTANTSHPTGLRTDLQPPVLVLWGRKVRILPSKTFPHFLWRS